MSTIDTNHWSRIVMDERTKFLINNLNFHQFDVLEISGGRWEYFGFESYTQVDFPAFDLCSKLKPAVKKETYDLVIAEQVFEHIPDPEMGIYNIFHLLREGGYVLITTPFLIKYHPCPSDYWRWTREGLALFLKKAGFIPIEIDSWGNYDCLIANLTDWVIFDRSIHSIENNPDYPVTCWGLAKKAGSNFKGTEPPGSYQKAVESKIKTKNFINESDKLAFEDGIRVTSLPERNNIEFKKINLATEQLCLAGQTRFIQCENGPILTIRPPPISWAYGVQLNLNRSDLFTGKQWVVIEFAPIAQCFGVGLLNNMKNDFHTRVKVLPCYIPVEIWLHIRDIEEVSAVVIQNWDQPLLSDSLLCKVWSVREL